MDQDSVRFTRTGRVKKARKGLRIHECTTCGKVYTRNEHLKRHQSSHSTSADDSLASPATPAQLQSNHGPPLGTYEPPQDLSLTATGHFPREVLIDNIGTPPFFDFDAFCNSFDTYQSNVFDFTTINLVDDSITEDAAHAMAISPSLGKAYSRETPQIDPPSSKGHRRSGQAPGYSRTRGRGGRRSGGTRDGTSHQPHSIEDAILSADRASDKRPRTHGKNSHFDRHNPHGTSILGIGDGGKMSKSHTSATLVDGHHLSNGAVVSDVIGRTVSRYDFESLLDEHATYLLFTARSPPSKPSFTLFPASPSSLNQAPTFTLAKKKRWSYYTRTLGRAIRRTQDRILAHWTTRYRRVDCGSALLPVMDWLARSTGVRLLPGEATAAGKSATEGQSFDVDEVLQGQGGSVQSEVAGLNVEEAGDEAGPFDKGCGRRRKRAETQPEEVLAHQEYETGGLGAINLYDTAPDYGTKVSCFVDSHFPATSGEPSNIVLLRQSVALIGDGKEAEVAKGLTLGQTALDRFTKDISLNSRSQSPAVASVLAEMELFNVLKARRRMTVLSSIIDDKFHDEAAVRHSTLCAVLTALQLSTHPKANVALATLNFGTDDFTEALLTLSRQAPLRSLLIVAGRSFLLGKKVSFPAFIKAQHDVRIFVSSSQQCKTAQQTASDVLEIIEDKGVLLDECPYREWGMLLALIILWATSHGQHVRKVMLDKSKDLKGRIASQKGWLASEMRSLVHGIEKHELQL